VMDKAALQQFSIPSELGASIKGLGSDEAFIDWENKLLSFFALNYQFFTPYPDYFRLRTYEFRVLRQLLPGYFDLAHPYSAMLELGCNFGYKSVLLSPFARKLFAVDIPDTYEGCDLGDFERTTDIAKIIVNEKMAIPHVEFKNCWPHELPVDAQSLDLIFSEYVLEHIPDLSAAVKEMHRVLKKGAVMVHTVPNTHDHIRAFLEANVNLTLRQLFRIAKSQAGAWLKKQYRNQPTLRWNKVIVPPCHSEHIRSFSKQLDIYTLENYLSPMFECGFRVEKIMSTRENNHVIVVRKG
ncbi:MAG: class I SAM-dependent methyltransferase, partial [Candidatus Omnitrophica bacterium]|nr:class I SAM-dependent methyltransferase [Candidatus Omnitrophota bacterium]